MGRSRSSLFIYTCVRRHVQSSDRAASFISNATFSPECACPTVLDYSLCRTAAIQFAAIPPAKPKACSAAGCDGTCSHRTDQTCHLAFSRADRSTLCSTDSSDTDVGTNFSNCSHAGTSVGFATGTTGHIGCRNLAIFKPTDWAFQALQSLVERYGCIVGYPDKTYRGNRALTRYEFAAGLNACMDRINELIAAGTADRVKKEDLVALQKL